MVRYLYMSGLNRGTKYTYTYNKEESFKQKEGVSFSEKSKKWVVLIENNTKSKHLRPFIRVAQFDKEEDAKNHYDTLCIG